MSAERQSKYLDHLLETTPASVDPQQRERQELEAARKAVSKAHTEEELQDVVDQAPADERQAYNAAHAERAASEEVEASTEHRLRRFARLMDANPRAMKRLVTNYGMLEASLRVSGVDLRKATTRDQLVLWTILSMRWPEFALYLSTYPNAVNLLKEVGARDGKPSNGAEQVLGASDLGTKEQREQAVALARRSDVQAVLRGENVEVELTTDVVGQFTNSAIIPRAG